MVISCDGACAGRPASPAIAAVPALAASSVYLFCYYMGSSIAGASGGLFYASHGWTGVALFVGALVLAGLLIALRLFKLPPLVNVATPPTPMSKGAMP